MTLTAKIDELGKPAWIAATVLGFVIWWPVGLATLAFVIWSGRMGCGYQGHWQNRMERMQAKMDRLRERMGQGPGMGHGSGFGGWGFGPSSGNRAFDEYRSETLRRLEEEQREFRDFLGRLRMAKDKAEFDQFMADRRNRPADTSGPQAQAQ
jgi:hypothetical protein